jgi:AraC-like DNA-binding protein
MKQQADMSELHAGRRSGRWFGWRPGWRSERRPERRGISKSAAISFLSITLTVALLSMLISLVLYRIYQREAFEAITASATERHSGDALRMSMIGGQINITGLLLASGGDFLAFMRGTNDQCVRKYLMMTSLRGYVNTNQYIESVYMFNDDTGDFISNRGHDVVNLDAGFKEYMDAVSPDSGMTLTPRRITGISGRSVNVFSVTFFNSINPAWRVVINLKGDQVARSIASETPDAALSSKTLIVGANGQIFIDNQNSCFDQPLDSVLPPSALPPGSRSGFALADLDGEESIVSWFRGDTFDLTFVNIAPMRQTMSNMIRIQQNTALICVGVILLGALLAVALSFRMLFPFRKIIRGLPTPPGAEAETGYWRDEAAQIARAVSHYEKSLRLSWRFSHREFLRELTLGRLQIDPDDTRAAASAAAGAPSAASDASSGASAGAGAPSGAGGPAPAFAPTSLRERFLEFSIPYIDGPCRSMYILLYEHTAALSGDMVELLDMAQNALEEIRLPLLFVEEDGDALKCVIASPAPGAAWERFLKTLDGIRARFAERRRHSPSSVSFVLGREAAALEHADLKASTQECEEWRRYAFLLDRPLIIDRETVAIGDRLGDYDITAEREALLDALRMGNVKALEEQFAVVFRLIRRMTYDLAKVTVYQLTLSILHCGWQILGEQDEELRRANLQRNLDYITNADEARLFLFLFSKAIAEKAAARRNDRRRDMCREIREYVLENYADPNLCAESVAERHRLSAAYVSKQFSAETGKSVFAFINDVRLNRAEELLSGTSLSVADVTRQIGFSHSTYFATLFKKKYGMSPKAYRDALPALRDAP